MASSSQNLTTNIVINAKTGNGFSKVGATLTEMGSIINGASQKLLEFGRESVEVYKSYESSMRDAEVALSTTYGRGSAQLKTVMDNLDTAASEWAASSSFHTNDIANAISEAAHAGWDYDQIMEAIPTSMAIAKAGSMDLSESVDMVVKSMNAAGIEFDDASHFADVWTFAANSSATTVEEVGEAMLAMGSTMRFATNPEELLTLIAATANAGAVGSQAGTLLRSSMMRLIAPTAKAEGAMAELGATTEEIAEIMGNEEIAAANAALATAGFSGIYDENGNMRSVIDTFEELHDVLVNIAGGEDFSNSEDAMKILGAIFPTRTITEALNLLNAAGDGWDGLYESMMNGDAVDYAEYASDTMMDTLQGQTDLFESKIEELQRTVGSHLAPQMEGIYSGIGGIIDSISGMDSGAMESLISGMEAIAIAGPTLIGVGGAFRIIGSILGPTGFLALGVTGVTALATALNSLEQTNFAGMFGDGGLDTETLSSYVQSLGEGFDTAYADVDKFNKALETSITDYTNASTTFSSNLLTAVLTGNEFSPEDVGALESLGDTMVKHVVQGIADATASSMAFWSYLFGGEGEDVNNETFLDVFNTTNTAYEQLTANAEAIGENLRKAITAAFDDGTLTEEERLKIEGFVQELDAEMALIDRQTQDAEQYAQRQLALHKAGGASLEEVQQMAGEAQAQTEAQLAQVEEDYLHDKYRNEYLMRQQGRSQEEIDQVNAELDAQYATRQAKIREDTQGFITDLYTSMLNDSDLGNAFRGAMVAGNYVASGEGNLAGIYSIIQEYGIGGIIGNASLSQALTGWLNSLGGEEAVQGMISDYASNGNMADAEQLLSMYTAWGLASNFHGAGVLGDNFITDFFGVNGNLMWNYGVSTFGGIDDTAQTYQNSKVSVEPDTSQLEDALTDLDGENLTATVDGDVEQLEADVHSVENGSLVKPVRGNLNPIMSQLNNLANQPVYVNVIPRNGIAMPALFAEGGRASEASIFGEAGPEWAIPEEHTQRTAELLAQAASASGFTWAELLSMSGGLNSSVGAGASTIVYSPTINASGDTRGLAQILKDDKDRLMKLLAERDLMNNVEVYA